jgi:hypothetical protein
MFSYVHGKVGLDNNFIPSHIEVNSDDDRRSYTIIIIAIIMIIIIIFNIIITITIPSSST